MILIIDDQKDIATGLERLLRYAGHEAVSVTGGADALAMLHVRKPALVVLDVNMPDMDGLTVLKSIREQTELKDAPVVMYSTDTHHKTMTEVKELGAVDFLVKGAIGFDKLVTRICALAGEPETGEDFAIRPCRSYRDALRAACVSARMADIKLLSSV